MRAAAHLLLAAALLGPVHPVSAQDVAQQIVDVLQTQAEAFNRGDLEGVIATLSDDVEWRTIRRELLEGADVVRPAMQGWISGMRGDNVRLTYPEDRIRVRPLSGTHAVADVVLFWDAGPERASREENLFLVFQRRGGEWRVAFLRNTTSEWCGTRPGECGQ